IRHGLRRAFEQADDFEVVGEAGSLSEAMALDRAHRPDVLVIDINLGDGSGLDLVRHVRGERPGAGLVVLTMYDEDVHLLSALEAGASCFVLKQAPVQDVVAAARQAASAPGTFAAEGLPAAMRRQTARPAVELTSREDEILKLLALGMSVSEVSKRLFVSASTTKTHMAKVYSKLGATNRTQAVMNAVRLGLVTVDA
ncbi:MAG: two component transcriptional regulator, LuxR family, partial [Frankiales bacterium]|nr:two component transcriptional regulator, LuxR family [Frankiales bacterium]